MIKKLGLINFKCFSRQTIPLSQLTLLTGLNGMGKSSVIQALLIISQSTQNSQSGGRLITRGDYVDLGDATDILHDSAKTNSIAIIVSNHRASAVFRMQGSSSRPKDYTYKNLLARLKLDDLGDAFSPPDSNECRISSFQYLQAERNGPRKFLPTADDLIDHFEIGSRGEYVLHLLALYGSHPIESIDPRIIDGDGIRIIDQTEAWLNLISPGIRIDLKALYEADIIQSGFSFSSPGELRSRTYRATNVGFGISYVLPVIVALLATPKGGMVIVENPEAHLHPQGQTHLGELCAKAAAAGIQVIIESHSDHFMDGIRIAVKQKILTPAQTSFHYFYRSGTSTTFKTPEIDLNGRLSEWPDGFNDQHRRNAVQLLKPPSKD